MVRFTGGVLFALFYFISLSGSALWKWINWYRDAEAGPDEYTLPEGYGYVFEPDFQDKEE